MSRKLWLHKSAVLDYKYYVLAFFIKSLLIIPIVFSAKEVALFVFEYLQNSFGYAKIRFFSYTQVMILFTCTLFIVSDFTRYWLHRVMHSVPVLWEFHKVHHSARVLTPITFYRIHPVENLLFGFRYALSIGVVSGVFIYFFGAMIGVFELFGVNILLFTFSLAGSNLRHSHIKISYPRWVENILISPYQHQIHHSSRYPHKNYGGYLAIWDRVFGTLKHSKDVKKVRFGIAVESFQTLSHILFTPFINSYKLLGNTMQDRYKTALALGLALLFSGCNTPQTTKQEDKIQIKKEIALGEQLFFDTILSQNGNQSCSTCHNPDHAFSDERDNGVSGAASLGDDLKSIGDRNAPTAAYAMFSPIFHFDKKSGEYKGGQFHDGREKDLKGQAGGPPTNPVEMGMPTKKLLAQRFEKSALYNKSFKDVYGEDIFEDSDKTYEMMAQAIGRFETTKQFAPFDSKYDRFLKDEYDLTPLEDLGRSLFFSNNNTNCASCHMLKTEDAPRETFSNYEYHNIGVPQNHALMALNVVDPSTFIDHGLLNNPAVNDKKHDGKIKVPTLRNIAITAPYMHNGVFQKLSTVVEFYDKYVDKNRLLNPETGKPWAKPEVQENINTKLLKKGKPLSDRKVQALVAFMNTLTDKKYEHLIKKDN